MYETLVKSPVTNLFGDYLESAIFIFFLTVADNLEANPVCQELLTEVDGKGAVAMSLIAAGMLYRICFSIWYPS